MAQCLPHLRIDMDIVGKRVLAYPNPTHKLIPLKVYDGWQPRRTLHNTTLVMLRNCGLRVRTATWRAMAGLDEHGVFAATGVDGTVIWDIVEHTAGIEAFPVALRSGFGRWKNGWRNAAYDPKKGPVFRLGDGTVVTECDEAILDYTGKGCELWVKGWR